jgi:MFS family permease
VASACSAWRSSRDHRAGLAGGALADAFDRRRLIWGAEAAALVVSVALVVNALLPHPSTAVLYAAAALFAAATAVLRPPLDALFPRLVERHELKAALALNWSFSALAMIGSPALAGVLIAAAGVEWATSSTWRRSARR